MTFYGCASDKKVRDAGADIGKAAARVNLPAWPDDCRVKEPHAEIMEGAEAVSVLKDERRHLDRSNARVTRCAAHYDSTATKLRAAG